MDMKYVLLELGERLISRHKFNKCRLPCRHNENRDTTPVIEFLLWLDGTPEARQELENMGLTFVRTNQFALFRGDT